MSTTRTMPNQAQSIDTIKEFSIDGTLFELAMSDSTLDGKPVVALADLDDDRQELLRQMVSLAAICHDTDEHLTQRELPDGSIEWTVERIGPITGSFGWHAPSHDQWELRPGALIRQEGLLVILADEVVRMDERALCDFRDAARNRTSLF